MRGRLLGGLTLAAAALTATAAIAIAGTPTNARVYSPFTASGRVAVHVTKTARGRCFTGSIAVNHRDAWRCMIGNDVIDPCFSSPRAGKVVLCPTAGPSSASAIEIKLNRRLSPTAGNHAKPSTRGLPWTIETTSGLRCTMATGATTLVDGKRLDYFCDRGNEALWGAPSRRSQPWTILQAPVQARSLHGRVAISDAWF